MVVRVVLLIGALLPLLRGQDTAERTKASDYPVHAQLPGFEIGLEYLVHNIPAAKGEYWAKEYLVVEAAIFPAKGSGVRISGNDFTLRVNGKKILYTVSPGTVAAALKYPDWEQRPNLSVAGGIGDGSVIVGAPPAVGRFPGDPTGVPPMRAPQPRSTEDTYGVPQEQSIPIDQAIANVALPEGLAQRPAKGCVFPVRRQAQVYTLAGTRLHRWKRRSGCGSAPLGSPVHSACPVSGKIERDTGEPDQNQDPRGRRWYRGGVYNGWSTESAGRDRRREGERQSVHRNRAIARQ